MQIADVEAAAQQIFELAGAVDADVLVQLEDAIAEVLRQHDLLEEDN